MESMIMIRLTESLEWLKERDIPYIQVTDGLYAFCAFCAFSGDSVSSMMINNTLCRKNNMTFLEIYNMAKSNMQEHVKFESLNDVFKNVSMKDLLATGLSLSETQALIETHSPAYILTTDFHFFGAGIIAIPEVLSLIIPKGRYYILPSSKHEVIVIPGENINREGLLYLHEMVMQINLIYVSPQDKLSDSVFMYEDGILSRVC